MWNRFFILAEWIGENFQEALGFPDKGDVRAGPGFGWTAAELNHILQAHVVDGTSPGTPGLNWTGLNSCTFVKLKKVNVRAGMIQIWQS